MLDRYNEGIEIGEKRGIEQGKRENSFQIARNMKINSIPLELIVKLTNLKKENVEKIQ